MIKSFFKISASSALSLLLFLAGCSSPKWEVTTAIGSKPSTNISGKIQISINKTEVSVPEGAVLILPASISAKRTKSSPVSYSITSSQNDPVEEFSSTNGTIEIAAGDLVNMFSITSTADNKYEGDETYQLSISTTDSEIGVSTPTISVTVVDDDPKPTLAVSDVSSSSETGSLTFTVTLTGSTSKTTSVSYTTVATTATAGADYTEASGQLSFAPGVTTQTVTIPLLDDAAIEGTELFNILLSNPIDATISDNTGVGTIIDDESYPIIALASSTVMEGAGTIDFTVTASATSTVPIVFNYSTTDGSAVSASDFTSTSSSATIPAGQTAVTISIPVINDSIYEDNETFALSINSGSGYTVLGSTLTAVGTISNDDPAPTVAFAISTSNLTEAGTTGNISVSLNSASDVDVSVPFSLTGTAELGSLKDFTLSGSPLIIPAGQISANIAYTIIADSLYEENETVILTLGSPTNGTLGATTTHTLTITNDDSAPTVAFAASTQSIAENSGSASIQVNLSEASGVDVSLPYTLSGTAVSGASDDYTIDASPLIIPAGSLNATIHLTAQNDATFEASETVILTMGSPTNGTLGATTSHTLSITNDDPAPTVNVTSSSQTLSETSPSATINITLSSAAGVDLVIPFSLSGTASLGAGSDGGANADYTSTTSSITILAGQTTGTISFSITNDNKYELDETIVCTLTTPPIATLGSTVIHTATLTSDDSVPNLTISDFTVQPGAIAKMTVTVSPVSGVATTFDWSTSDGTALSPTDYTSSGGSSISIPADTSSVIVNVSTIFQSVTQATKSFNVNISNATNATITDSTGVATIQVPARGALDLGFANGLWDEGGGLALAKDIVVQADGKILLGGGSGNVNGSIYRFNQNSTIDTSFGANGRVLLDKVAGYENVNSMALQTDGKIIAFGTGPYNTKATLYRMNSNGTMDTSFNSTGFRQLSIGTVQDNGNAVGIQADGKIVIAGATKVGTDFEAFVMRLNSDGTTDTSFATSGLYTFDGSNADDSASSLLIQPDGKIVIAGYSYTGATRYPMVLRLNTDGTVDSTFNGGSAKLFTALSGHSFASLGLQSGSKLLMSGGAGCGNSVGRLNGDGSYDTSFATVGYKTYGSTGAIGCEYGFQLITLKTGKFFILGNSNGWGMYICEFNANGSYNTSFGTNGCTLHTPGFENVSYGFGAAMSPDGRILVSAGVNTGMQLARIWNNADGLPTATLTSTGSFAEGATASAQLTLEGKVTWPISFHWQTADETATAGLDYTAVPSTNVTLPGSSNGTILSTSTINDGIVDSLEVFIMSIIDITGASGVSSAIMSFSN